MGFILSKFRFGCYVSLLLLFPFVSTLNIWVDLLCGVISVLILINFYLRSKPSTKDALEKIDQDLRKLSRFQYDTELQQKRIIGRLVIGGVFLYLVFLVLAYFFGPRDLSWQQTLACVLPFIVFPFLLIMVKRLLGWYFNRKIVKNKDKYEALKKEKQRLLDDVMENETFKVAKEILEKYAPNHLLPKYLAEQQKSSPMSMTPVPRTAQLRRRNVNAPLSSTPIPIPYSGNMGGFTPRAIRPFGPPGSGGPGQFLRQPTNNFARPALMPGPSSSPITPGSSQGPMPRGPPPPRFMLPPPPENPQYRTRKTGWIDKLVDYVVGDGPANRFALICRYCATHNGLATPEDFPYIGYRCVYCRQFNPPRQVRPSAATLPKNTVLIEEMDSTTKSPDTTNNEDSDKADDKEDIENKPSSEQKEDGPEESSKETESEVREPLIELAASSTEDLTRSVESLLVAEGTNTDVDGETNEQEEQLDDDSLKDDATESTLNETEKETLESTEDKESQDTPSASPRTSL